MAAPLGPTQGQQPSRESEQTLRRPLGLFVRFMSQGLLGGHWNSLSLNVLNCKMGLTVPAHLPDQKFRQFQLSVVPGT